MPVNWGWRMIYKTDRRSPIFMAIKSINTRINILLLRTNVLGRYHAVNMSHEWFTYTEKKWQGTCMIAGRKKRFPLSSLSILSLATWIRGINSIFHTMRYSCIQLRYNMIRYDVKIFYTLLVTSKILWNQFTIVNIKLENWKRDWNLQILEIQYFPRVLGGYVCYHPSTLYKLYNLQISVI